MLFHIAFLMCQVSYFQCTYTDPGGIPDGFPEEVHIGVGMQCLKRLLMGILV